MVVPGLKFLFFELMRQLRIDRRLKGSELKVSWALYDWLTFAIERESPLVRLECSKLLGGCDQSHIFAVPHKDSAFTWRHKDETVSAIINVKVCSDIKDKKLAIWAVLNIKLLFLDWIDFLYFEAFIFVDESIIVRIELFLLGFGFEYIGVKGWFGRLWSRLMLFF